MSVVKRYCIFFSYFGQFYRGSQFQPAPVRSVQDSLQKAIREALELQPTEEIKLRIAARTDSGVHAVVNAMDVLLPSVRIERVTTTGFAAALNSLLRKLNEPLRVSKVLRVAPEFNCCRLVTRKTYVYKLALIDDDAPPQCILEAPVFEHRMVTFVRRGPSFDMELVKTAAQLLSGINDYTLFTTSVERLLLNGQLQRVVRECQVVVERGQAHYLAPYIGYDRGKIEHWNIVLRSQGFLYKQVRYMVGSILAVGNGNLRLSRLEEMLMYPERGRSTAETFVALPYGLYLTNLEYPHDAFSLNPKDESVIPLDRID